MTTSTYIDEPLTVSQQRVEGSEISRPEIVHLWPQWFPTIDSKIRRLARLTDGWDGYQAPAIDHGTLVFSVDVLGQFLRPSLPEPQVVPTPRGGLQLEWHINDIDLEVEIHEPYSIGLYFEDLRAPNDEPLERTVTTIDRATVERMVSRLVAI